MIEFFFQEIITDGVLEKNHEPRPTLCTVVLPDLF